MAKLVLQYHNHRHLKPSDDDELIVLFHLSLMEKSRHTGDGKTAGEKPGQDDCFWIEVRLQRFLGEQAGWAKLDKEAKVKQMFQFAVDQIRAARRKLRHAHLFWTASSDMRSGPTTESSKIEFPTANAIEVESENPAKSFRFQTRAGAGL